jgi:type IV pilus assembly protein PilV
MPVLRTTPPSGFSLVEVLVSLVVLSVGMLGVGKLVLFTSRADDSAYMRSQATALAYTILDSMRANRQTALTGSYAVAYGVYADPGVSCNTVASACSGTIGAQYDLYQWKSRLLVALGSTGDGQIVTVPVPDASTGATNVTASIQVRWNDTVAQQSFGVTTASAQNVVVVLESVL